MTKNQMIEHLQNEFTQIDKDYKDATQAYQTEPDKFQRISMAAALDKKSDRWSYIYNLLRELDIKIPNE